MQSDLILTDSGGIQEEAPYFRKASYCFERGNRETRGCSIRNQ